MTEVLMRRRITGFHLDDNGRWMAELECGHNQPVQRRSQWASHRWTKTKDGRARMLGHTLDCRKCGAGEPADRG